MVYHQDGIGTSIAYTSKCYLNIATRGKLYHMLKGKNYKQYRCHSVNSELTEYIGPTTI